MAARFELTFVDSFDLPFNTGVVVCLLLVIAPIVGPVVQPEEGGGARVAALSVG